MLLFSWCTVRLSRYRQKRVSRFEGRRSGSTSEHWDSCPATWNIVSVLKTTGILMSKSHKDIKIIYHHGILALKPPPGLKVTDAGLKRNTRGQQLLSLGQECIQ